MSSKTASKVSVFDFMSDDQQDATLTLMIEIESRILDELKRFEEAKRRRPGVAHIQQMSLHLITLIEGVIRLEHAAEHGIFKDDRSTRRVFNSIVKDTLRHTRAV